MNLITMSGVFLKRTIGLGVNVGRISRIVSQNSKRCVQTTPQQLVAKPVPNTNPHRHTDRYLQVGKVVGCVTGSGVFMFYIFRGNVKNDINNNKSIPEKFFDYTMSGMGCMIVSAGIGIISVYMWPAFVMGGLKYVYDQYDQYDQSDNQSND